MMKDPLNKMVMEDIGLSVDKQNKIIDQDTRESLVYKEKNMKYSSSNSVAITSQDVIFDPANNRIMMGSLFNHFLTKIEEEDEIYVPMYYEKTQDNKSALVAKVDGKEITTDYYANDSLKYMEMIKKLNGSEDTNLKSYDSEPSSKELKKPRRKKKAVFK